jgi:hypothetical protein
MKRSTFRILFYVKRGDPKKNGSVAIIGRITIDDERAQFNTKLEIHPDQWDNRGGRAKGSTANAANLNRLLESVRAKAFVQYNHLMEMDGYVMPNKIKNALLGIEEKGKTIMFYFDKFNKQCKHSVFYMLCMISSLFIFADKTIE